MNSKTSLYRMTLAIEVISSFFRAVFVTIFVGTIFFVLYMVYLLIRGGVGFAWYFDDLIDVVFRPSIIIGFFIGFYGVFTSIKSYLGYGGGGTLTRFVLGAREPSTREKESIHVALKQIMDGAPGDTKGFSDMYIIDSPFDQVNLIGTTLYISSGAAQSENSLILLAHEIGHLNQGDGALILALRRLVFPLFQIFIGGIRDFSTNSTNKKSIPKDFNAIEIYYFLINKIIFLWLATLGGGLGVWLLGLPWADYFRSRDYEADKFVARLGWGDQLIEYLEQGKFYDTSVPYMLGWRPANELRIDRLQYPHKTANSKSEKDDEAWAKLGRGVGRLGKNLSNGFPSRSRDDSGILKDNATQAPPSRQAASLQQDTSSPPDLEALIKSLEELNKGK